MLKLVYLAKRKPGFGFDDFVRRWREHGARTRARIEGAGSDEDRSWSGQRRS